MVRTLSAREEEGGKTAQERVLLWLNCRLGERVNVGIGGAWALEVHGELRHWRGIPGLYQLGDTGLLDLNGIGEGGEVCQVRESSPAIGVEQMVVEFDDGTVLAITIDGESSGGNAAVQV